MIKLYKMTENGFNEYLKKINFTVVAENYRAISLYEKLGFVHEGKRTMYLNVNGKYHDQILMGELYYVKTRSYNDFSHLIKPTIYIKIILEYANNIIPCGIILGRR